jgi:biopolymer transport protein ExbD
MGKKRGSATAKAGLDMTPMIDVVFQLIIFFVVTLKQEDILSHLDVSRPAPDPNQHEDQIKNLIQITVFRDGYVIQGKRVSLEKLDRHLMRLAEISRNPSIIIRCTSDSQHARLVQVLDICAKAGLTKLSVFSM